MKFLKLGDLHIGVRQDDPWIQNIQLQGIRQAIDYSKSRGITTWLQAGDWFDVRKAITHKTMNFNRKICQEILDAGIKVYVIVGNHDATFKNTIFPNACDELLTQFENFTVISSPTTIDLGVEIDMVPWICEENREEILKFIKASKSKYCMGHFELNGFYFYKGMESHGEEPDFLKSYKRVWSGHFHTISENKNVTYIGTPWSLTAGDENDPRGFWEFDSDTEESKFIQNNTMWHRRIDYPTQINPEIYKNLSVRLYVTKVDKQLAAFETALENVVHELKVVNRVDTSAVIEEEDTTEVKSLSELIDEYVESIEDLTSEDATAIKDMSKLLYLEASK
ncbi:recombination endonuclease subunit [Acinetobacter phage KARL-1]|uniref:Recombination endonuclease subunit n=1 Tax=Acinetobacter phage KARL-1 TaxID=2301662 RepID=A0A385IIT0_9CAUD|nr:SbcD-like subunit of palindrome specific endonuclease [Acinetobacter phage KARL-1]AXY82794.1 recombination endonuclease subunit [Acinetobacter phage KARL-1]